MTMENEKTLTAWRDDPIIEIEKIAEKLAEAVNAIVVDVFREILQPLINE